MYNSLCAFQINCSVIERSLQSERGSQVFTHNNLKHPVKKEVNDTEMLLEEERDNPKENDVKNEIDKMETLELLDNLVNFLNDA